MALSMEKKSLLGFLFLCGYGGGCFEKQMFCVKITKREFYERYKNTRHFVRTT